MDLVGCAFKLNIGFGVMLYKAATKEYRYFYSSGNSFLFDRAITIASNDDIEALMKRILELDLLENYYLKRPSSGWTLAGLPNVELVAYPMQNVVYGVGGVVLTEHVRQSRSIRALTHDHGVAYADKKCFFRALAHHLNPGVRCLERLTSKYLAEFE